MNSSATIMQSTKLVTSINKGNSTPQTFSNNVNNINNSNDTKKRKYSNNKSDEDSDTVNDIAGHQNLRTRDNVILATLVKDYSKKPKHTNVIKNEERNTIRTDANQSDQQIIAILNQQIYKKDQRIKELVKLNQSVTKELHELKSKYLEAYNAIVLNVHAHDKLMFDHSVLLNDHSNLLDIYNRLLLQVSSFQSSVYTQQSLFSYQPMPNLLPCNIPVNNLASSAMQLKQ